MASNFVFPEWLNSNSVRGYPLSENGTRLDLSGDVKLPDALIVDASLSVHPEMANQVFFVSEVRLSPEQAIIQISRSVKVGGVTTDYVVGLVTALTSNGLNKPYSLTGTGDGYDISGTIVVGDIARAAYDALGVLKFSSASTPFEPATLNISLPMVRAIEIYDGESKVNTFTGVLRLKAGRNIRLSYEEDEQEGGRIRIDAIDGLNTIDPNTCSPTTGLGPPIRTINGQGPDENGNFTINSGECIEIGELTNGISISDTCSKTCCGCDNLAKLVAGLQALEQQCQTLKNNIYEVQANTSRMMAYITAAMV